MRIAAHGRSGDEAKHPPPINRAEDFEAALKSRSNDREKYKLRLYVTGSTSRSSQAIECIRTVCELYLQGRYELEVIDIHQQPARAQSEQIIAAPTLIKMLPIPLRKIIGSLSDIERVLMGLDIQVSGPQNPSD